MRNVHVLLFFLCVLYIKKERNEKIVCILVKGIQAEPHNENLCRDIKDQLINIIILKVLPSLLSLCTLSQLRYVQDTRHRMGEKKSIEDICNLKYIISIFMYIYVYKDKL